VFIAQRKAQRKAKSKQRIIASPPIYSLVKS